MAETEEKTGRKRLSPGKRKFIRRVKQESRKLGISPEELKRRLRQAQVPAKES